MPLRVQRGWRFPASASLPLWLLYVLVGLGLIKKVSLRFLQRCYGEDELIIYKMNQAQLYPKQSKTTMMEIELECGWLFLLWGMRAAKSLE